MSKILQTALFMAVISTSVQAGCGDSPDPCEVAGGTYHAVMPESVDTPPAVIWLHGAGGTGAGAIRNTGMKNGILDRGYAFIAVDGLDRPGRFGTGWYFHPERPQERDEVAFLTAVADDASDRFGLDRDQIILSGFSVGGSMTSYFACQSPDTFDAYAPVAGSFWKPEPTECAGPVRLLHTHGWRDTTVPLEGRPLGGGTIYQGDVWQAMQVWRAENSCAQLRPDSFEMTDAYWRRVWEDCAPGTALEFALHPGAHSIPPGWAAMTLDWYEALER